MVSKMYHYEYTLKSGEVQSSVATVTERVNVYSWMILKKLPLFHYKRRFIDVDFSEPVGEGIYSDKGGVLGCVYDMEKGETPEDCIRRMMRERKFDN